MPVRRLPKGVRNADRALDAGSAATRAAARGAGGVSPAERKPKDRARKQGGSEFAPPPAVTLGEAGTREAIS